MEGANWIFKDERGELPFSTPSPAQGPSSGVVSVAMGVDFGRQASLATKDKGAEPGTVAARIKAVNERAGTGAAPAPHAVTVVAMAHGHPLLDRKGAQKVAAIGAGAVVASLVKHDPTLSPLSQKDRERLAREEAAAAQAASAGATTAPAAAADGKVDGGAATAVAGPDGDGKAKHERKKSRTASSGALKLKVEEEEADVPTEAPLSPNTLARLKDSDTPLFDPKEELTPPASGENSPNDSPYATPTSSPKHKEKDKDKEKASDDSASTGSASAGPGSPQGLAPPATVVFHGDAPSPAATPKSSS